MSGGDDGHGEPGHDDSDGESEWQRVVRRLSPLVRGPVRSWGKRKAQDAFGRALIRAGAKCDDVSLQRQGWKEREAAQIDHHEAVDLPKGDRRGSGILDWLLLLAGLAAVLVFASAILILGFSGWIGPMLPAAWQRALHNPVNVASAVVGSVGLLCFIGIAVHGGWLLAIKALAVEPVAIAILLGIALVIAAWVGSLVQLWAVFAIGAAVAAVFVCGVAHERRRSAAEAKRREEVLE